MQQGLVAKAETRNMVLPRLSPTNAVRNSSFIIRGLVNPVVCLGWTLLTAKSADEVFEHEAMSNT